VATLVVVRGLKSGAEYPIYEGDNYLGRADEKPVDIDLEIHEPPERIWTSRQHALITCANGVLEIQDLNSANGTYVNRNRVLPMKKQRLQANDVVQVGSVQLKLVMN
jgi:predicted component of type VI protein secretion system